MSRLIIEFRDPEKKFSLTEKGLIRALMEERFERVVEYSTLGAQLLNMMRVIQSAASRTTEQADPPIAAVTQENKQAYADGIRAWADSTFPGLGASVTLLSPGL